MIPRASACRSGLGVCLPLLLLIGCTAIPDEGPSTSAIVDAPKDNAGFVVIDLDDGIAQRLGATNGVPPAPAADEAPAPLPQGAGVGDIGIGDVLHVTLWQPDPADGTLLDHSGMDLSVRVDADGAVSVPYAGRIHVAGRRPASVERALTDRLASQAVSPQVSVLVADDQSNSAIVEGAVAHPGRVPVGANARRLSDMIALAGGPRAPDFATLVTVDRDGTQISAGMQQLHDDPTRDIEISPGDRITLSGVDRHFFAFGAVNRPGEQTYEAGTMTLAAALGHIAGLQDGRANPAGLFIFRRQPAALTRRLLTQAPALNADLTKVVYRLNLRDPQAFFTMAEVNIAPDDIVYVSNAPLAEIGKFASIVAGISSVGATPRNLGAY